MIISALLMFVRCVVLLIIWAKTEFSGVFFSAATILCCDFIYFWFSFASRSIFYLVLMLAFLLPPAVCEKKF